MVIVFSHSLFHIGFYILGIDNFLCANIINFASALPTRNGTIITSRLVFSAFIVPNFLWQLIQPNVELHFF